MENELRLMCILAFGQVFQISETPFQTFEDSSIMSWIIPESQTWAVVLKESVKEIHSQDVIPVTTMHYSLTDLHEHFAHSVSVRLPSSVSRKLPSWLLFEN